MSVWLWDLQMVGPKMQDFCPRIDMLKGNCFKTIMWWIIVRQKVQKLYFQSQFRRPFLVKNIFSNFNFWTTLFSKIMPYFWRTGAPCILKIQWFPLSILIIDTSTTQLILLRLCVTGWPRPKTTEESKTSLFKSGTYTPTKNYLLFFPGLKVCLEVRR